MTADELGRHRFKMRISQFQSVLRKKRARPSSITEDEASLLVKERKLMGEGAKYEKNICAKVVPAK